MRMTTCPKLRMTERAAPGRIITMDVLTVGNSAKLYCLNWIEQYAQRNAGKISILDLGCGTALNFVALLKKYPQIHYVGIEPFKGACLAAERNLKGLDGTIIN